MVIKEREVVDHNVREQEAKDNAKHYTCVDYKPLGKQKSTQHSTLDEATTNGKLIISKNPKAKILIYGVDGTNWALLKTIRED
tara:strand:+ start:109 stop:357 length:249 start_codon:yes stop_codon:yes gene_type:complete